MVTDSTHSSSEESSSGTPLPQKKERNKYQNRTASRLACVQGLFQVIEMGMLLEEIVAETLAHGAQLGEEQFIPIDPVFYKSLLEGAVENCLQVDEKIKTILKEDWPFDKLDKILLAILRVSIHELSRDSLTDTAVIIKEYMMITESFFDDKKVSFVHRSLDHLSKTLR
jgi:transcription antitermination factor NusB